MATKYFTEDRVWELLKESEISKVEGESTRWHRDVTSIVEDDEDGKFYRIYWRKGSTEMQDSEAYSDDYEEVFKYTATKGVVTQSYLTETQLKKIKENGINKEVEALKLVAERDAILDESESISLGVLDDMINTLNKIELLNVNSSMNIDHKITLSYLERLKEVKSLVTKN